MSQTIAKSGAAAREAMQSAAGDYTLATRRRDAAILEARENGIEWAEVCSAFGISEPTARRYSARAVRRLATTAARNLLNGGRA